MFRLKRYHGNPILESDPSHLWESKAVLNTAAIFKDNKIHLVYRACGKEITHGVFLSSLGYAVFKNDGVSLIKRYKKPVFKPQKPYENWGVEDPRISEIKSRFYLLYTAYLGPESSRGETSIAMASSANFIHWKRSYGLLLSTIKESEKNGVLFPKKINNCYVLYYRIFPNIWVAYSKSIRKPKWFDHKIIASPRKGEWDQGKIGAGAPPILTKDGWLFIYHGINKEGPGRKYCLGVMLIDKNNPEKILYRSKEPILKPERKYEKKGYIPNVVFSCGAVVVKNQLLVYYGAADTVVCLATCSLNKLLKAIRQNRV